MPCTQAANLCRSCILVLVCLFFAFFYWILNIILSSHWKYRESTWMYIYFYVYLMLSAPCAFGFCMVWWLLIGSFFLQLFLIWWVWGPLLNWGGLVYWGGAHYHVGRCKGLSDMEREACRQLLSDIFLVFTSFSKSFYWWVLTIRSAVNPLFKLFLFWLWLLLLA